MHIVGNGAQPRKIHNNEHANGIRTGAGWRLISVLTSTDPNEITCITCQRMTPKPAGKNTALPAGTFLADDGRTLRTVPDSEYQEYVATADAKWGRNGRRNYRLAS